jgi:peptidoglycan/xylan/chitin deacetylase (PgdA/CDA1 family)
MKFPNTVINFHVIKDMKRMESILMLLKQHYNFVSAKNLEDFYYGYHSLRNACHITVDDGDLSVYTYLFPLIKKHQIPISIYVSPLSVKSGKNFWFQEISDFDNKLLIEFFNEIHGTNIIYINNLQVKAFLKSLPVKTLYELIDFYKEKIKVPPKNSFSMDIGQILELNESKLIEIGAHTMTHPILSNETKEISEFEIKNSIDELSDILSSKVQYFAYPNGIPDLDFGEREIKILRNCGVKLAFTTENKRFSKLDNPLAIPRNGITKGSNSFILSKLIFGNSWLKLRRLVMGKQEFDYRKEIIKKRI